MKPVQFKPAPQISLLLILAFLLFWGRPCQAQTADSVAVFDPQVNVSGRYVMNVSEMNGVAQALQSAGWRVGRVTTAQITDPAAFNAKQFTVLVLRGDAVPREDFPGLTKFAQDGGIVVALAAKAPFLTAVTRTAQGTWLYSPETPAFAWQTSDISDVFGFRYTYRPAMLDSGLHHTATALFKKYLPQATDYDGTLPSTWIYPVDGGTFYPLVRSRRGDGRDVTPQVYIARKEGRTAVVSSSELWTKGGDQWAFGPQTTVALVKIALDLHSGALQLAPTDSVDIPADLPPAEPLTSRLVRGEVNPDNAPVVARWGKFNGSGLELTDKTTLPRVLAAGAAVTLPLRQNGKPEWLRVRAAVSQNGAALKVEAGGRTLWNEAIAYAEVGAVGNFGTLSLSNVPVEFNRRVFLPPASARRLTLSNPGTQPLYFDAVQVENDPVKPVRWMTGMGASWNQTVLGGPSNLPRPLTREWTGLRSALWAQDIGAPGDPARWALTEKRFQGYNAPGVPLELLLSGTPRWVAISPARSAAADRWWLVPPDPQKYKDIVQYVLTHHAREVSLYEIWNEEDSQHFWLGTAEEYVHLWRAIVPMLRKGAPNTPVMVGGLTGFDPTFLETLAKEGVLQQADMVGFHPYAGAEAAWDKPFGNMQGQLYSLGANLPIYNNEMGFPTGTTDWFTPSTFPYTVTTQKRMTEVALARLLANNVTMFSIFLSGGSDGGMSYINGKGQPYPAYVVLQDYFKLSQNGGHRLDIAMCRTDGGPQTGVYLAGSEHSDGSITVVINPAEVVPPRFDAPADAPEPDLSVPLVLRVPLAKAGNWKAAIDGHAVPLQVRTMQKQTWGEIVLTLKKRSVLSVSYGAGRLSRQ